MPSLACLFGATKRGQLPRSMAIALLLATAVGAGDRIGWAQDAAPPAAAPASPPPRPLTLPEIARRDRLRSSVEWLASPERQGRGPGTAGIDAAAEWVAGQFVALGLDTSVVGEASFQPFPITLDATLGAAEENMVEVVAPPAADGSTAVQQLSLIHI